jgi:hypothetical protein
MQGAGKKKKNIHPPVGSAGNFFQEKRRGYHSKIKNNSQIRA